MFTRYRITGEGLTNLFESNNQYLINIYGQVKDKFGNDVPSKLDADGHVTVNVTSWDGQRDYRVIDLMVFQYKTPQIEKTDYDKVIAFAIDGNKSNLNASNVGYRFKGGRLEHPRYPGFFYIPMVTMYVMNIAGDVYNAKLDVPCKWFTLPPNKK